MHGKSNIQFRVEQYWRIIQKMKEINNNGMYASAYSNWQASENVIRRMN
jgi:hypothetical protein